MKNPKHLMIYVSCMLLLVLAVLILKSVQIPNEWNQLKQGQNPDGVENVLEANLRFRKLKSFNDGIIRESWVCNSNGVIWSIDCAYDPHTHTFWCTLNSEGMVPIRAN